jgi:hypothetical protein
MPPPAVIGFKDVADAINSAFATFWIDCLSLLDGLMIDTGKEVRDRLQLDLGFEAELQTMRSPAHRARVPKAADRLSTR